MSCILILNGKVFIINSKLFITYPKLFDTKRASDSKIFRHFVMYFINVLSRPSCQMLDLTLFKLHATSQFEESSPICNAFVLTDTAAISGPAWCTARGTESGDFVTHLRGVRASTSAAAH